MFIKRVLSIVLGASAVMLAVGVSPRFSGTARALPPAEAGAAAHQSGPGGATIPYSGRLTDDTGQPVADGAYDLAFALYTAESGGEAVWSETQMGVSVRGGAFTVALGSVSPLPDGAKEGGLWLEVGVRGPGETGFTLLSPRQPLSAALLAPASPSAGPACAHDHFGENWIGAHVPGLRVEDTTTNGTAIVGVANTGSNAWGVEGISNSGRGVYGWSSSGYGVYGYSVGSRAVYGWSTSDVGVWGQSTNNTGVVGKSDHGVGVWGEAISTTAVYGKSTAGHGVYGVSTSDVGVYGQSTSNTGVAGWSNNFVGVWGQAGGGGSAVLGQTSTGTIFDGRVGPGPGLGTRVFRVDINGRGYFNGGYQIGGADLAEFVQVSDGAQPGDVVEIDPDHAGQFRLAATPNSTAVAGVLSTAPGGSLGATDPAGAENSGPQLALAGRVPVKVSAENGAIHPGDLLVASSTPGHAMRAPANPAPGTVIGKALGNLESGAGVIEMLVMLR